MKKIKHLIGIAFIIGMVSGCNYLDIVPDNIATIDYAFRMRSQAEKYLFTCYSYLPDLGDWGSNPSWVTGDEIWFFYPYQSAFYGRPPSVWEVARGNQNISDPYLNYWDGSNGGKPLFQAIRDCNTFLENIGQVHDMEEGERNRWIAEVQFLKAYYHWFLLRMYGPVPIIDQNLPVSAGPDEVAVVRQPVDSVFNYITGLIDEATANLPEKILDPVSEMGRITRPIALALKAQVLVTYASPFFNGNADMANFVDKQGVHLFNGTPDPSRWEKAANACKAAIDLLHEQGYQLNHFSQAVGTLKLGPEMQTQMDIRTAITQKWNSEIVWGATNSLVDRFQLYTQTIIDPKTDISSGSTRPKGEYAPPMKIAEQFYTNNGVPIDEDRDWDYAGRYDLQEATEDDRYYIKPGYTTARLNFNREPRFYADLSFDGGMWFGQGNTDQDNAWYVEGKNGQFSGKSQDAEYSITGYSVKKLVNYLNVMTSTGVYQIQAYPFPMIRLADLYLYYAEALNEVHGADPEALEWINRVRERAGIPTVEESWTQHSTNPGKYQSQNGLRAIIHQERLIEMAFEGDRFWDLRRWKEAERELNKPITGWDVSQTEEPLYYQQVLLFNQSFRKKDYLWPLRENTLIINNNLVQNPGW